MFRPGPEEREKSFEELCSRSSEYTAMFCASDYYAILMMNELSDRGIRVPQDISVAGFDDNLLAQLHRPALTTVHQDVEGKGIIAAETLVKMIKGEKIRKRSLLLPTELRIRESVCDLKSAK